MHTQERGWLGTGRDAKLYLKHGNGLNAKAWTTVAFITISPVTSVHITAWARLLFRDLISQHNLRAERGRQPIRPKSGVGSLGSMRSYSFGIDADDDSPRRSPECRASVPIRACMPTAADGRQTTVVWCLACPTGMCYICSRERGGKRGRAKQSPYYVAAARCTAFPTDGLLSCPRTQAQRVSTPQHIILTTLPDALYGREDPLVEPSAGAVAQSQTWDEPLAVRTAAGTNRHF